MVKRIFAATLIILMVFSLIPFNELNISFASSGISQGEVDYIGGDNYINNPKGGNHTTISSGGGEYPINFRVSISRDPDTYMDGTPDSKARMIDKFGYKYPKINSKTQSLFFRNYFYQDGVFLNDLGIATYDYGKRSIKVDRTDNALNQVVNLTQQVNSTLVDSLNRAKIDMQNDGILTSDGNGKDISVLGNGTWQQYVNSYTFSQARRVWEYVATYEDSGSGYLYEPHTRLDRVISSYLEGTTDLRQDLTKGERDDVTAGYVGALISLYKIANERNLPELRSYYGTAIEDYVNSSNMDKKPVSIIIDTALSMGVGSFGDPNRRDFMMPSYDYMEYIARVPREASMVENGFLNVTQKGFPKADTKRQLLRGADASLNTNPFDITGNTFTRISDGTPGNLSPSAPTSNYTNSMAQNAFAWVRPVAGFYKNRLQTTASGSYYDTGSNAEAGFMDAIKLKDDIKGFTVTSHNILDGDTIPEYEVLNPLKEIKLPAGATSGTIESRNTIGFIMEVDSSTISALESRLNTGTAPSDAQIEIQATVERETYVQDILEESKTEIPTLSAELSGVYEGTEALEILRGKRLMLKDMTVIGDTFDLIDERTTINIEYDYYINIDILIGGEIISFTWDEIAYTVEGVPQIFAEQQLLPRQDNSSEDEEDTDGGSKDPDTPFTPGEESTMINQYAYSTTKSTQFAELKNNTIGNEEWEVMAGVPSTEEIYFSAGGTEYLVSLVVQYWMNEVSVPRTYRTHYDGTECEYKAPDTTPNKSLGGYSVDLHDGGTYTKTWTGTRAWTGSVNYSDHSASVSNSWDDSEYNAAKAEAQAYISTVNGTTLSHTAGSDGITRSNAGWNARITTDTKPDGAAGWADPGQPYIAPSYSIDSDGNSYMSDSGQPYVASSGADGTDGNFTITVTFDVPQKIIDGPCSEHNLPAIQDTWEQNILFDYAKISQIRLFEINQASVTGLEELTGMDEIFATIQQGDPTYFLNIAQMTEKGGNLSPNDASYISSNNDIAGHKNTLFSDQNREQSQSSQTGRLRYSLEPEQHDEVVWHEGTRTNKCDGLAQTHPNNVVPAGGLGHDPSQPWAVGILYTNNTYSDIYDKHMHDGSLTNKSAYSDQADNIDIATAEWRQFDTRRRTETVATVISDFLILQTSGGDKSIYYFDKSSDPVEAQDQYTPVHATQEEMFTNNPNSIFNGAGVTPRYKIEEQFIPIGGYNGHYNDPNNKHEPYSYVSDSFLPVNGDTVTTFLDNDPANSITRPPRNGKLLMYQDNIQIKPSAPNKVYKPTGADVFYKQVLAYYSTALDRLDTKGNIVNVFSQLSIGNVLNKTTSENLAKWGDQYGLQYSASYDSLSTEDINPVVVFSPVSAEDATVLPPDDINVKGQLISRDQRVPGTDIPNLTEELNNSEICPLDPGLCEFRILNCQYYEDSKVADFDFEPTYEAEEITIVDGSPVTNTTTKQNTYQSGSTWVTTNQVSGIEYALPSGFTVGNSGVVGDGRYLQAFGTRWAIPFSDLGITNEPDTRVSVKMDFYMNSRASKPSMLVSFKGLDFWLNPNDNSRIGMFNTGGGSAGTHGAGIVEGDAWQRKTNIELVFGFNNLMEAEAYIDGVPVDVKVQSTKNTTTTNADGTTSYVSQVVEMTNPETNPETIPTNLNSRIGDTINIGSYWNSSAYPANYYLDNIEIWLKGGTHEHSSTCYKTATIEKPNDKHVHTESCLDSDGGTTTVTETFNDSVSFNYTGGIQTFTAPETGTYTLETWGAQGGGTNGGRGGYSKGKTTLNKGEVVYIGVGNQGTTSSSDDTHIDGGYNGGGAGYGDSNTGGGGGATHMATRTGQLYQLSSYKSDVLIVAAGGGGQGSSSSSNSGGDGGGSTGERGSGDWEGGGGSQTSGGYSNASNGSFGRGGNADGDSMNMDVGGGGGGWYGGGGAGGNSSSSRDAGGGGGSNYVTGLSATSSTRGANSGNGKAKISYSFTVTTTVGTPATQGLEYAIELIKGGGVVAQSPTTFNYTGSSQTFTAPNDGEYLIELWGAQGGIYGGNAGRKGAYVKSKVTLSKNQTVNVFVGQQPSYPNGGYNGGASQGCQGCGSGSTGGGGATDIRIGGTSLSNRVVVAGGGGGKSTGTVTLGPKSNGVLGVGSTTSHGGGGGGGYHGGAAHGTTNYAAYSGTSYVNGTEYTGNLNGTSHQVIQNNNTGHGVATITPLGAEYTLTEVLGPIYDMIANVPETIMTVSNFNNVAGFFNISNTSLSLNSNEIRVSIGGSNARVGLPVDIDADAVTKINLKVDNYSSGTSGFLYYKSPTGSYNTSNRIGYTMSSNQTNQTIELDMLSATGWSGDIGELNFNLTNASSGTVDIKSIEFIGFGTGTQPNGTTNSGSRTFNNTSTGYNGSNSNNSSGSLTGNITMSGGKYIWTVPNDGIYQISAKGAQGGTGDRTGGKGAYIRGEFNLSKNEKVHILVGQAGYKGGEGAGGGGGSFVIKEGPDNNPNDTSDILVIAGGGGGGAGNNPYDYGNDAYTTTTSSRTGSAGYGGAFDTGNSNEDGGGGGGFIGNAGSYGGTSFINGGYGDNDGGGFGGGGGMSSDGAGGGGGYSGGDGNDNGGGYGGGSYNSGSNKYSTVNNTGHGTVTITGLSSYTPMVINHNGTEVIATDSTSLESYRTLIKNNMDLIPNPMINGDDNPLFSCNNLPLNAGASTKAIRVLNCTEPHHSGEHYDTSNTICWDACEDDSNHVLATTTVETSPGVFTPNADFLQLDNEFTIYFPNQGDFDGNNALGLKTPQAQTGIGYSDNMDTTQWTREKRVSFDFDVLYNDGTGVGLYPSGTWIELDINQDYYDFYLPISNTEVSNAGVYFEVEAINGGVDGILGINSGLRYNSSINTDYSNALTNFKNSLEPRWITEISNGFKDANFPSTIYAYESYFTWKKARENTLESNVSSVNSTINNDFWNKINDNAKTYTSNDNYNSANNRNRSSSMQHLHGGSKTFYLDVIGRIGNFAIVDTEDYRFSNFFKESIPDEWIVDGFINEVEPSIQKFYVGDEWDIKGNEINSDTRWLNTYDTQEWAQGTFETSRNNNDPNIKYSAITGDLNNITQLQNEQLRYGYDIFTNITTIGSYRGGRVLVTPYYYALNLNTGAITPVDAHISKDGIYEPVNLFNNAVNGVPIQDVYEYTMNLDWTTESERRNYTLQEQFETKEVAEHFKEVEYDYSPYNGSTQPPNGFEPTIANVEEYRVPSGAYNYLGTAQAMVLDEKHRTFVGNEISFGDSNENSTWGIDKNPDNLVEPINYTANAQKWHFKLGLPSSTVFVEEGLDVTKANTDIIMNDEHVILSTMSVIAQGNTWAIEYQQPWLTSIDVNGTTYNLSTDINGAGIPPLVGVYSADSSSALDVDIIKTH